MAKSKYSYRRSENRKRQENNNHYLHLMLYNHYKNIYMNMFEWENFPENGDIRYFEEQLFEYGTGSFFSLYGGILTLKNANGGELNIYGRPVFNQNIGFNFNKRAYTYIVGDNNNDKGVASVICYDDITKNFTHMPSKIVNYYVAKMVNVMQMFDTKLLQAKKPFIISTSESQKNNVENVLNDIDKNVSAIIGNEALDETTFNVLQTGVTEMNVLDVLKINSALDNELKEKMGLNNNKNIDKKERLIVDELNNNNVSTNLTLDSKLKAREEFCAQVNELWNIGISVKINENVMQGGETDVVSGLESEQPDMVE